ncbi:NfeD family protein [Actinomadura sp. KC345]|uniref:NfeD family protein n=1 Tax=Actinomadura sp. KC345 TaxID=2530371 RepID=UPI001FB62AA1|nr:NfeD family protein [Actinomadura sp. KC345]
MIWLAVAAVLGVLELLTVTIDLGLIALAALAGAGAAGLGLGPLWQFGVFALVAAAGLGLVRPYAKRLVNRAPALRSGTAALIGQEAVALSPIDRDSGLVRLGGEEWTARPYVPDLTIAEGTRVEVLAIEGATALVHPQGGSLT